MENEMLTAEKEDTIDYVNDTDDEEANNNDEKIAGCPKDQIPPMIEGATWRKSESNFLMEKYYEYDSMVGRFKSRTDMWKQISNDLYNHLKINKSHNQCLNRYKTVLRARRNRVKKTSIDDNFETVIVKNYKNIGNESTPISVNKQSIDIKDSFVEFLDNTDDPDYEPNSVKRQKLSTTNETLTTTKNGDTVIGGGDGDASGATVSGAVLIRETLLEIHRSSEENKERRHKEMMGLWRTLITEKFIKD